MISVPPIGRVRAAGNSVQGFERFLTRKLGEVLVAPTSNRRNLPELQCQI
jgi:hypothetical protein